MAMRRRRSSWDADCSESSRVFSASTWSIGEVRRERVGEQEVRRSAELAELEESSEVLELDVRGLSTKGDRKAGEKLGCLREGSRSGGGESGNWRRGSRAGLGGMRPWASREGIRPWSAGFSTVVARSTESRSRVLPPTLVRNVRNFNRT